MSRFWKWFERWVTGTPDAVEKLAEYIDDGTEIILDDKAKKKQDALVKEWPIDSRAIPLPLKLHVTGHTESGVEFKYMKDGVIYSIEYNQDQLRGLEKC